MSGIAQTAQAQLAAELGDLMTPEVTARDELNVKEKTLANWRSARLGPPYVKLSGGIVRYSRSAVRKWLAANTVDHGGAA